MKNIIVNDRGIFEQEPPQLLSIQGLTKRKRLIEGEILHLRGKIQDAEISITNMKREIAQAEEKRKILEGPLVQAYIVKEKQRQTEIQIKAQTILKECIGDDLYNKLQEKRKIVFTAKDNQTYKIEANGRIFRQVEKDWRLLCIIRPQDLPLPDFLLALFVSIREHPTNYQLRRR